MTNERRLTPEAQAAIDSAARGTSAEPLPPRVISSTAMRTSALRFVERDGRRILQQGWSVDGKLEWRDVPLETE